MATPVLTGDGEAHVVVKAELLGSPEEALELRMEEIRYRNDEPAPILPHVHSEVALRHFPRQPLFLSSTPPQARTLLQYLFQYSRLGEPVRLPDGHSPSLPFQVFDKN